MSTVSWEVANARLVKQPRVLIEIQRTGQNIRLTNVADFPMNDEVLPEAERTFTGAIVATAFVKEGQWCMGGTPYGSIAVSTDTARSASHSLKLIALSAGEEAKIQIDATPYRGEVATFTVYVEGAASKSVRARIQDDDGNADEQTQGVDVGTWTAFDVSMTVGDAATALQIKVRVNDVGGGTVYIDDASLVISGQPNDALPYIKDCTGITAQVNPQECTSQIGGFSFSAIDKDEAITAERASEDWKGQEIAVTFGYPDVAEEDFKPLFRGKIVGAVEQWGQWTFSCADLKRSTKKNIFTSAPTTTVSLSGNPITIALQILMSTGSTGANGTYDTLAAVNGLGIDQDLIDMTTSEALRDDYFPNTSWEWEITEDAEAKAWIEKNICKPLGVYMLVNRAGQIYFKRSQPLLWAEDPYELNEDNIVGVVKVDDSLKMLANEFYWKREFDSDTGEWADEDLHVDEDSLGAFDVSKRLTIESEAASGVTDRHVERRNSVLFSRFADPYPGYSLQAHLTANQLTPGDVVSITHSTAVNFVTGARGVSNFLCEILSEIIKPLLGKVNLSLVGTPWNEGKKYVVIAPASVSHDWASATDEEKRKYAWIGQDYTIMPG